jgi:predicted TIM-barrel fold metal-dependent hydrolase
MLPAWDISAAVAEATRGVGETGARAVQIPAPYVGDYKYGYLNKDYDRLWACLVELDVPLTMHIGSGYPTARHRGPGATMHDYMDTFADSQNMVRDFICGGVFDRFPGLRLAATEGGIGWAPWYMMMMDRMYEDNGKFLFPKLPYPPSQYFARNCLITWQEDEPGIRCLDMIADSVAWGSDYPHREGTFPNSRQKIAQQIGQLDVDLQRKVCADNAARIFGFDLDLLVAKYGPDSDHGKRYSSFDGGSVTPEMVAAIA